MLTKSLHTVTAATNVARLLLNTGAASATARTDAPTLAAEALQALGYDYTRVSIREALDVDVTVQRIAAGCQKLINERRLACTARAA